MRQVDRGKITQQDAREGHSVFRIESDTKGETPSEDLEMKLDAVKKEINYFERSSYHSEVDGNPERANFFDGLSRWARLESDSFRKKLGLPMKYQESQRILEDVVEGNDYVKLEKVKKWPKENGLILTGVVLWLPA